MDPQFSDAVSHAIFRYLDAKIHHIEWKSFLLIFGSTVWEQVDAVFTLYWFLKWHFLLPKGQQKLTTFSDLVKEGLIYLQLFLELPETVWSLQNRSYIKKTPLFRQHVGFRQGQPDFWPHISRQNVTRGGGVCGFSRFSTFFIIQDFPEPPEGFWEL